MDSSIVTVDGEGRIFGNAPGTTSIKISSYYSGNIAEREIIVLPVIPLGIEITSPDSSVYSPNSEVKLTASILPLNAKQDILWISSDETIAKVNEFGLVTFLKSGEVVIEAKAKETDLRAFITLKVAISPFFVFDNLHVFNPIVQNNVMHWAYNDPNLNQSTNVYGSVSRYLFSDLNIDNTSYWLSSSALNFDQRTFDKPEYIVIHDTWNPSGGGAANAALITSPSNTKTCWHFTVGNDGIFQSLPENQYGKHAGDGGLNFSLFDTMIKADTLNPNITISEDGYWEINYQKTNLLAPLLKDRLATKNDFTDSGILVEINEQGYYVIGTTYYNATYNKIANTGGNAAGIGIETAMNFGSDLYLTWQKTAKLTADLMYRYHLDINRVRQHHFFSGKDCPRTMRKADLWEEFLNLVEGEYLAATNLKGYTVKFISNNPEYVNNWGRIVKLPNVNTKVSYTIQIFLEGDMMGEKTYYSFLQAI
ncbi:MAG: N-acetylmuramoyl-L-alanine amidase [Bacilli bacterium]